MLTLPKNYWFVVIRENDYYSHFFDLESARVVIRQLVKENYMCRIVQVEMPIGTTHPLIVLGFYMRNGRLYAKFEQELTQEQIAVSPL